jgi:hypothetical protein
MTAACPFRGTPLLILTPWMQLGYRRMLEFREMMPLGSREGEEKRERGRNS